MRRFSLLFPFVSVASPVFAEDDLTFSASTRVRYETIANQPRLGFDRSDDLLNVRTIVTGEYRRNGFRIGAELYDSRAYDSNPGTPVTTNEVNALELVQAYVGYEAREPFGAGSRLALQGGRFTLNLGSRRLIAADDYRNTTNGYTGLRADLALAGGWSATTIYTLPQIRLPEDRAALGDNAVRFDRESFDLVLWGGVLAKKLRGGDAGTIEASYFHLGERDAAGRPTRDRSLDTYGIRLFRDPSRGKADFDFESFRQTGSISLSTAPTAIKLDVAGWYLHAEAGYTLSRGWSPRFALEFDYASGDGPGGSFGRFDTLFGMRRGELAPAGLYNAVGRANILAPGMRLEVTPSKRLDVFAAYRPLWLASRFDSFSTTGVRDASGASGRFAGHQLEARIRWWLVPEKMRLEWNGLLLAKGRFMRDAPNAPAGGNTVYNSLNATWSF